MNEVKLYLDFRKELDEICVPELLKFVTTEPIYDSGTGEQAGIFCYVEQDEFIYIDCIYIVPNHRIKGLAKQAVTAFFEKHASEEIRLHIINKNKTAHRFWHSLFELLQIECNPVDTLYRIRGRKKDETR